MKAVQRIWGFVFYILIIASPCHGLEWAITYGGSSSEGAASIQQTADGGYIVAGWTHSFGPGGNDIWLLKLAPNGYVEWEKVYGRNDYDWTYAYNEKVTGKNATDGISHRQMGRDELETPHIELIYRLLVMQHPDYSEFKIQDSSWAWARRRC